MQQHGVELQGNSGTPDSDGRSGRDARRGGDEEVDSKSKRGSKSKVATTGVLGNWVATGQAEAPRTYPKWQEEVEDDGAQSQPRVSLLNHESPAAPSVSSAPAHYAATHVGTGNKNAVQVLAPSPMKNGEKRKANRTGASRQTPWLSSCEVAQGDDVMFPRLNVTACASPLVPEAGTSPDTATSSPRIGSSLIAQTPLKATDHLPASTSQAQEHPSPSLFSEPRSTPNIGIIADALVGQCVKAGVPAAFPAGVSAVSPLYINTATLYTNTGSPNHQLAALREMHASLLQHGESLMHSSDAARSEMEAVRSELCHFNDLFAESCEESMVAALAKRVWDEHKADIDNALMGHILELESRCRQLEISYQQVQLGKTDAERLAASWRARALRAKQQLEDDRIRFLGDLSLSLNTLSGLLQYADLSYEDRLSSALEVAHAMHEVITEMVALSFLRTNSLLKVSKE